ncbi:calcium-binding protein [Pseudomonas vanderleydeniana]|uniref:M10 family metallopeptidase C-terminal domain-containing protein n=1 Tax=Pseudomonas vanderleydeniana TaxID=2745495 RepID=A0A9E6PG15_9PSED|nr:M10 family metallopeptidase C-terminal domain-containing protein [Pseudomonas vanderleydeniana]QXI25758.1 M10 family metallopeptidase C-terminal domain-containing protein [Pseudomonas vanderleydeniana]
MFSFALTPYASGKELPRDQIVNFNGTIDNEYIVGNALDNHIVGGGGHDVLLGGAGNDTLEVGHSSSVLYGGDGDDLLIGGDGSDHLRGGDGEDRLKGGDGNDILEGGAGLDWLEGGAGRDAFVYRKISDSTPTDADWITDFVSGEDKIDLSVITGGSGLTFVEQFTGRAGEAVLGYDLVIDFNGNGAADFRVMTVGQALTTDIVA